MSKIKVHITGSPNGYHIESWDQQGRYLEALCGDLEQALKVAGLRFIFSYEMITVMEQRNQVANSVEWSREFRSKLPELDLPTRIYNALVRAVTVQTNDYERQSNGTYETVPCKPFIWQGHAFRHNHRLLRFPEWLVWITAYNIKKLYIRDLGEKSEAVLRNKAQEWLTRNPTQWTPDIHLTISGKGV